MKVRWALLLAAAFAASCGGGGGGEGGGQGAFRLIEFLEQGQDGIPRNRVLTFLFSAPVADGQDFFERLKIQNTQGNPGSNFSLAVGTYEPIGDRVTFAPRLPNAEDRSDAGFRENGNYTVFLKAGPDALRSATGDPISNPQEMLFDTSEYFEDPFPADPPRVKGLFARDVTKLPTEPRTNLGRLDPRPGEQALLDNADLIDADRFIEPGAGSAPQYATPWRFELDMSEPVDPSTATTDTIQLFEIYSDATTSGEVAAPFAPDGWLGTSVSYKVPVNVAVEQQVLETGEYDVKIVVQPLVTLVDNTRYRLIFGGSILGIDFRQQFIGVNGLTGDGQTVISGTTPYPEPGGLGYTTEFIVRDRPAITSKRTLTYSPITDGIKAELGQTTTDADRMNTALYNPAASPSTAVGYLAAFGNGTDGDLSVSGGTIVTIDTGDTPNPALGKPFSVWDLNPNDNYNANTLPGGSRSYDSRQPFELNLQSLTVTSGARLRFVGVNPVLLRVTGIAQIAGTIDVAGGNGQAGGSSTTALGGTAGPGGGNGGLSKPGGQNCTLTYNNCAASTFSLAIASCWPGWPGSLNGDGPGRGHAGGSAYSYPYYSPPSYIPQSGTGGGGGSRATKGTAGSDITSASASPGEAGNCAGVYSHQNSSVVGVRGMPGPVHGDAELFDVTWGGSGGGAGGSTANYSTYNCNRTGGTGGGGGGMFTLACAGAIQCQGGRIDASGGDGGNGAYAPYAWYGSYGYYMLTGGGGGGSAGGICLISGDNINASNAVFDATGGAGGAAPNNPTNTDTTANAGGAGGKGFIYLMDADGTVPGLLPGTSGTYPNYTSGYLTIAPLSAGASRFGDIRAVTELFNIPAANPAYLEFNAATDILAQVNNANQQIFIYASTAKGDSNDPLLPNVTTEIPEVLVARVHFASGATQVDTSYDAMDQLNPTGPNRDAYIRINALFEYGEIVEAALGPFASMDRVDISYSFN